MWVKVDDGMPHHPKLVAAGPQAFALDVAAICYASRYDTDGFVADGALAAVLPGLPQVKRHAKRLVEIGRWLRNDERGGYDIHDYEDYQFTSEERADRDQVRSDKGVFANHKRWHVRRGVVSEDCPHCFPELSQQGRPEDDVGNPQGNPKAIPNHPPSRPDPKDLDTETHGVGDFTTVGAGAAVTNGDESQRGPKQIGPAAKAALDEARSKLGERRLA